MVLALPLFRRLGNGSSKKISSKSAWINQVGKSRKSLIMRGEGPSATMEDKLVEWISEMRDKRNRVSCKMVRNKAIELSRQDEEVRAEVNVREGNFVASNGWLNRFFQRHNLTLRRKTTQGQKILRHYVQKLKNYIIYIRSMHIRNNYNLEWTKLRCGWTCLGALP